MQYKNQTCFASLVSNLDFILAQPRTGDINRTTNLKLQVMHLERISFITVKKTLLWLITLLGIWVLVKP